MANEAHKEPTMEEILASIRKIISDDDPTAVPAERAPTVAEEPAVTVNDDGFDELRFDPGEDELNDSMFENASRDENSDTQDDFQDAGESFADSGFEISDVEASSGFGVSEPISAPEEFVSAEAEAETVSWDVDAEISDTPEFEAAPEISESEVAEEVVEEEEDVSFEAMLGAVNKVAEDFDAVSGDIEVEIEIEVAEAIIAQPKNTVESMEPEMSATPNTQASRLTDDATAGAAAGSLGKLFSTMEMGSENTIDGLVREMLKPMIKEWLDANLAKIVEQKVEAEVQRIASMAR